MAVRLTISSTQTGGAWSFSKWTVPPYSAGMPLHWHATTQKLCYVLGGMLAWTLAQRTFTITSNEWVLVIPGTRHSFFNPAAAPATLLMWSLPGGIEQSLAAALRLPGPSRAPAEPYDVFLGTEA